MTDLPKRARRVVRDIRKSIPSGVVLGRRSPGDGPAEFVDLDEIIDAQLDAISSTRGSILYRGASGWVALSPGTAGQVLHTNGPGADPTWDTDDTGGGGGGGYFNGQTPLGAVGVQGGAFATKAIVFQPLASITVDHVNVALDPNGVGDEYIVRLAELDSFSATATVNSIVATSPTVVPGITDPLTVRFTFASPVALSAATPYAILFSWNNAPLGTSVNRVLFATNGAPLNAPVDTQQRPIVSAIAKQVPVATDVLVSAAVNQHIMAWLEGSS